MQKRVRIDTNNESRARFNRKSILVNISPLKCIDLSWSLIRITFEREISLSNLFPHLLLVSVSRLPWMWILANTHIHQLMHHFVLGVDVTIYSTWMQGFQSTHQIICVPKSISDRAALGSKIVKCNMVSSPTVVRTAV